MPDIAEKTAAELYETYKSTVFGVAYNYTRNAEDARDITQEVFLRLLKALSEGKRFDGEEHVKAWLIRVAMNASKKLFGSSWFRRTTALDEGIAFVGADSGEKAELFSAVMALPKKYRVALHLFYYEDMTVAEISDALGEKEVTIRVRLSHVREKLKEELCNDGTKRGARESAL